MGVPGVNIGSRQHLRERAENVIDVDYSADQIESAIRKQMNIEQYKPNNLYGSGNAGLKIASILATVPLKPVQKHLTY